MSYRVAGNLGYDCWIKEIWLVSMKSPHFQYWWQIFFLPSFLLSNVMVMEIVNSTVIGSVISHRSNSDKAIQTKY